MKAEWMTSPMTYVLLALPPRSPCHGLEMETAVLGAAWWPRKHLSKPRWNMASSPSQALANPGKILPRWKDSVQRIRRSAHSAKRGIEAPVPGVASAPVEEKGPASRNSSDSTSLGRRDSGRNATKDRRRNEQPDSTADRRQVHSAAK